MKLTPARMVLPLSLLACVVLMAGAVSTPVFAADAQSGETVRVRSLPPPPAAGDQTLTPDADYKIGPMDVLEVSAQHVPEISAFNARVSGGGQITLPLVGDITANGRSAMQLQQDIADKLKEYIQAPQVTVFVKEYASQRLTVEGQVNQPGIYPMQGTTTLLQALALAHGTTEVASLGTVAVYRVINNQRLGAVYNLKAIRAGKQVDPQLYANDLVEVNTSGSKQLFHNVLEALPLASLAIIH